MTDDQDDNGTANRNYEKTYYVGVTIRTSGIAQVKATNPSEAKIKAREDNYEEVVETGVIDVTNAWLSDNPKGAAKLFERHRDE